MVFHAWHGREQAEEFLRRSPQTLNGRPCSEQFSGAPWARGWLVPRLEGAPRASSSALDLASSRVSYSISATTGKAARLPSLTVGQGTRLRLRARSTRRYSPMG